MLHGIRTQRVLRRFARRTTVGAVVLLPWLFAGADSWFALSFCLALNVAAAAWLVSLVLSPHIPVPAGGLTGLLLLIIAFAVLQQVPLPDSWAGHINPLSAMLNARSADVLNELAFDAAPTGMPDMGVAARTLSLSPAAGGRNFCLLIAYCTVFALLVHTIRTVGHFKAAVRAITISAACLAVVSMVHEFSGDRKLFWFCEPQYPGASILGPFTNRNHFALHMNIALGFALSLFLPAWRFSAYRHLRHWRDRVRWLSGRHANQLVLSGFAVMLVAGAACVSLSRGAMVSLIAALGFAALITTSRRRRGRRRAAGSVLAVVVLVAAAIFWLGWTPVLDRLRTLAGVAMDPLHTCRTIVTVDTVRIFGAGPWVGCGLGAFQYVFPFFQSAPIQFGRFLHAHNDWAQLLAESGLVGGVLAVLSLFLLGRQIRVRLPSLRRPAQYRVMGLLIGLLAALLHSFVDYGLHKPANGALLAALVGLLFAACRLTDEDTDEDDRRPALYEEERPASAHGAAAWRLRAGALILLGALALLVKTEVRELKGSLAFARTIYLRRLMDRCADATDLGRTAAQLMHDAGAVTRFCRHDPDAMRHTTRTLFALAAHERLDRVSRAQAMRQMLQCAHNTVSMTPSDYLAWLWLGRACAMTERWDQADLCLERARELAAPGMPVRLFGEEE